MQRRQNPDEKSPEEFVSLPASLGERSAVEPKSGESVSQSDPGLRRPTPPSTAGQKPAARPPLSEASCGVFLPSEAGLVQRKTGRGAGQSRAVFHQREALASIDEFSVPDPIPSCSLDDSQITLLIQFFQTLDRWDRELRCSNSISFEVNS